MKCLYSVHVSPRVLNWPFYLMTSVTVLLFLIAFLGLLLHSLHFVFILLALLKNITHQLSIKYMTTKNSIINRK